MGETVIRKHTARALFVVSGLLAVWSLILVWLNRDTWVGDPGEAFGVSIGGLAFAAVGLVITRSRSENPVGWIMLVLGTAMSLMAWGSEYALHDYIGHELPLASAAAYISNFVSGIVLASLAALALLFPTGKLRTRFWSTMMWAVVLGATVIFSLSAFESSFTVRYADVGLPGEPREVELAPPLIPGILEEDNADGLGFGLGFLLLTLPLGASVVRLIGDFVRGDSVERQQLKWVVYVLISGLSLMAIAQVPVSLLAELNQIGGLIILVGVPVAMGVAITRYRLYEIDRIVSRTVTYAAVVGFLALIFAVGVVLVPGLVPGLEDDALLVAMSTLVSAALFNPVRKRLQKAVDRRFNRSKYSAERVVEDFTGTLRDRVDPDGVADGWVGVVSEALEPSRIALWVRNSA